MRATCTTLLTGAESIAGDFKWKHNEQVEHSAMHSQKRTSTAKYTVSGVVVDSNANGSSLDLVRVHAQTLRPALAYPVPVPYLSHKK